jgi:hypothetical protein
MTEGARPDPAPPAPRAKDARPDPAAAAQRVKEGVRDLAHAAFGAAGDLASDAVSGYKQSTKYFKLRAYVVATWIVLGLVTFWAACPPSAGPTNSLGARAQFVSTIVGSQVKVWNESTELWKDVVISVEGGWRYQKRNIRPGDFAQFKIEDLTREDGAHAPGTLTPREITVECSDGKVKIPLSIER